MVSALKDDEMTDMEKIMTDCRAAASFYEENRSMAGHGANADTIVDLYRTIMRLADAIQKQRGFPMTDTTRSSVPALHTPGPWKIDEPIGDGPLRIVCKHGINVAMVARIEEKSCDANARLFLAVLDLLEAAQLLEAAETGRQDCDECEGEGEPEACGKCFEKFDDARVKRRAAIAKATGEAPKKRRAK